MLGELWGNMKGNTGKIGWKSGVTNAKNRLSITFVNGKIYSHLWNLFYRLQMDETGQLL